MGGLGNQLFQYAAARALSLRLGADLRLDLSYLGRVETGTTRHFELHHFRHAGSQLKGFEYLRFGSQAKASLLQRAASRVVRSMQPFAAYEEPTIEYDKDFCTLDDDTVLSGRFQSYRYFEDKREVLIDDLQPKYELTSACSKLCSRAASENSVALHVRRTDYMSNEAYRNVIQALPLDYYERALARTSQEIGLDAKYYVISDDITWCRTQSAFACCDVFVDLSDSPAPHIEEFQVLRSCRSFIISNSTFAWWGAWLGQHPNKFVVAPAQWSHNPLFDGSTRLPNTWRKC